ncbi:hypothetical protein WOSG25_080230 [Weissella oryzae SG25]|uniref:Glycosyltransferase RgtA/B/C/D-like domain-containing protein n=1 Tax=Weissella oryzae (strain DSM 25784 / JCM 18191 / LMG 30913 / SG25) TaxID=1329250 RepID=A0A069D1F9_WEIOS|nr:DUF6020 family protein [Weissella oryzae]GAK31191.1 hypothetical protein WOSG25_080230 [Weissella oryzae SG25]
MNNKVKNWPKQILKVYRTLYLFIILGLIAGSMTFGLYTKNYHLTLRLIEKNSLLSLAYFFLIVLILGIIIYYLKRLVIITRDKLGPSWLQSFVGYLYQRTHRLFILLAIVWLPFSIIIFPGSAGWDLAMQAQEIIESKAYVVTHHLMAPAQVYPIADYLVKHGSGLITNQHNFYLTFIYGGILKYSLIIFKSFTPGLALLATSQFILTVFAFAFTLKVIGSLVQNYWAKLIALLLTMSTFMIPISAWSLVKNPSFAAATILLVGILAGLIYQKINQRLAYILLTFTTLIILISVKYGWLVIFLEFVFLLFIPKLRKIALTTLLIPLLMFKISMAMLFATGVVVPDDPIEAKGIQIQQVALYVQEYPNDLTAFERDNLQRIFNLGEMATVYQPGNVDPVKSSGYFEKDSYRYNTIKKADWRNFNKIWLQMLTKHPGVFLRAALMKFYGYFDIMAPQYRDMTVDYPNFQLKGDNLDKSSKNNHKWRKQIAEKISKDSGIIGLLNSGALYIVLGLILMAIINKLFGWESLIFLSPFYIQLLAAVISPLNASVRYSLGMIYALPILCLLMYTIRQRGDENH